MDYFKYGYYSWFPSKDGTNLLESFGKFSPYGHYQPGIMANIYDITEQYTYDQVANFDSSPSLYLSQNYYATMFSGSNGYNLIPTDEDTKNKMNILKISSPTLTNILPWNKSDYVKQHNIEGTISNQSYIPMNTEQWKANFPTLIKLIIIGYIINYLYKQYM
jgi:hypothetical protein